MSLSGHELRTGRSPGLARKPGHARAGDCCSFRHLRAWELEALGRAGVIRLARDAVEARLPVPLAGVQERERAEREQLRVLLNGEAG